VGQTLKTAMRKEWETSQKEPVILKIKITLIYMGQLLRFKCLSNSKLSQILLCLIHNKHSKIYNTGEPRVCRLQIIILFQSSMMVEIII
jgi:hypothetical protein